MREAIAEVFEEARRSGECSAHPAPDGVRWPDWIETLKDATMWENFLLDQRPGGVYVTTLDGLPEPIDCDPWEDKYELEMNARREG